MDLEAPLLDKPTSPKSTKSWSKVRAAVKLHGVHSRAIVKPKRQSVSIIVHLTREVGGREGWGSGIRWLLKFCGCYSRHYSAASFFIEIFSPALPLELYFENGRCEVKTQSLVAGGGGADSAPAPEEGSASLFQDWAVSVFAVFLGATDGLSLGFIAKFLEA